MKSLFTTCCIMLVVVSNSIAQDGFGVTSSGNGFYRFDAQPTWLHGFHRTTSPFSGHASFRPSNYQQAIARAGYMQMYPSQFMSSFRRPTDVEQYQIYRAANSKPTSVVPPMDSPAPNHAMSPIRSFRISRRVEIPETVAEPPAVIRAIQKEETGPLFPLPPLR